MSIYFTSDEHHFHHNIILYCERPFTSVEHMTEELIARHNAIVTPDDIVYHLGDFSLGSGEKHIPTILSKLNGKKILISGNHDKCHKVHKGHEAATRRYLMYGFAAVYQELEYEGFLINHLPYVGDSGHEGRYPAFRSVDKGQWLLHGHTHQKDPYIKSIVPGFGNMINVGVDAWGYAPVSLERLKELRDGK